MLRQQERALTDAGGGVGCPSTCTSLVKAGESNGLGQGELTGQKAQRLGLNSRQPHSPLGAGAQVNAGPGLCTADGSADQHLRVAFGVEAIQGRRPLTPNQHCLLFFPAQQKLQNEIRAKKRKPVTWVSHWKAACRGWGCTMWPRAPRTVGGGLSTHEHDQPRNSLTVTALSSAALLVKPGVSAPKSLVFRS